jgi:hypothetical protein
MKTHKMDKIMEFNLEKSINRAIALLKTPKYYENYIAIKLSPLNIGCCCSDCLRETWDITNQFIAPCGPVEHEGDALIKKDGSTFVLEQHESGPEIIVYMALATASLTLAKSVIDLITAIIKALSNEHRKQPSRIKISRRQFIKGKVQEDNLIEIDIPISTKLEKQLEQVIKRAINENP